MRHGRLRCTRRTRRRRVASSLGTRRASFRDPGHAAQTRVTNEQGVYRSRSRDLIQKLRIGPIPTGACHTETFETRRKT